METKSTAVDTHPMGESKKTESLETLGRTVELLWDESRSHSDYGQAVYFARFLQLSGLYESWREEMPLSFKSNNAPRKEDVAGTAFLAALTGQNRYAHIASIRGDAVLRECFGIKKIVSEDSLRRNLLKLDPEAAHFWMSKHLKQSYEPLLYEPYILDIDVTVKTLYGHQENAEVGYNPHKPGRPSHTYHTCFVGNLRLVLNVDVLPGNQTAGKYSRSGLWEYLDSLEESKKPTFVRGDSGYGNEGLMGGCESRGVKYLFKLRKSRYFKVLINQLLTRDDWSCAGQDWEGVESRLYLSGWSRSRRVIVLRRHIRTIKSTPPFAKEDYLFDIGESKRDIYEYAVLVTDLDDELLTIAAHYRDRADAENTFDEMKNQWGWAGFTTQDITRCRVMARIIALCYNWRSIFIRLVIPHRHHEARTGRSLFLKGPGRLIRHGRNLFLKLTSIHGHYKKIRHLMTQVNRILQWISENAEQLKEFGLYRMILSIAFQYFLENRPLKVPQEFVLQ